MDKKKLEILLERCLPYTEPMFHLEQYSTPTTIAAGILNIAHLKGDIEGKTIYDLGCGNGILSIGCALMGADKITGYDIDGKALEVAKKNSEKFCIDNIIWVKSSVKDIRGKCDTVIQNPPFGVRNAKADRAFITKALEVADVIYTMHKVETREFVSKYINSKGGNISDVIDVDFVLSKVYKFHKKNRKKIKVNIFRIERSDNHG
jgi:putative methylase|tara:strand:+ start:362 stop:976 length:615 start_codon:yes stop_codon:yes gene_type:complete